MQLLLMFVLFPFQDFYSSIIHASIQFFLQVLFKDQILFKYYSRFRIHILCYSRSIQVFYSHSIHILFFFNMDFPVYQQMNYQRTDNYNIHSVLCITHSLDHDP